MKICWWILRALCWLKWLLAVIFFWIFKGMIGTWGMKYFKKLPLSITENTLELLTENSTCYGSRVKCILSLKSLIKKHYDVTQLISMLLFISLTIIRCIIWDRTFLNGKTHYVSLDYGCLTYSTCPSSGACVFLYNVDGMSCC